MKKQIDKSNKKKEKKKSIKHIQKQHHLAIARQSLYKQVSNASEYLAKHYIELN